MPNPLIESHKTSVQEFYDKFIDIDCPGFGDHTPLCYKFSEIKRFLLTRSLASWKAEVERLEGMKKGIANPQAHGISISAQELNSEFDSALDLILAPYYDAIKWANKELK